VNERSNPFQRIWFDPPGFRWRRVLIVSGVSIAVVVGWMLSGSDESEPAPSPLPVAVRSTASAAAPRVLARTSPSAQEPARRASADEVEICGGTWVKLGPEGAPDAQASLQAMMRDVRERTVAAMHGSASELSRAAALYLEASAAAAASRDQLARMALSTADPKVYGLAWNACGLRQEGACQMISAGQWARLDPYNAVPWLFAAALANDRKDIAAVDDAMHHVAKAQRSETGGNVLQSVLLAHVPSGQRELLGSVQLLRDAARSAMAPDHASATQYCKDEAIRDVNRRQACAEIADVLAVKSSALAEQKTGAAIGKRVGWSAQRVESIEMEHDAVGWALGTLGDGGEQLSCERAERQLSSMRDIARHGEVGAARLAIQRSGKSVAEWARAQREALAAMAQTPQAQRVSDRPEPAASAPRSARP